MQRDFDQRVRSPFSTFVFSQNGCTFVKMGIFVLRICTFLLLYAIPLGAQSDSIYTNPDMPALFPACVDPLESEEEQIRCSFLALKEFIQKELQYPEEAKEQGIAGICRLRYVLSAQGELLYAQLLEDPGGGCGLALLNTIRRLKPLQAAQYGLQAVASQAEIAVEFIQGSAKLKEEKEFLLPLWGYSFLAELKLETIRSELYEQGFRLRNLQGEEYPISKLDVLVLKKNGKLQGHSCTGFLPDRKMQRLFKSLKPGSTLILRIMAKKEFEVLEFYRELSF